MMTTERAMHENTGSGTAMVRAEPGGLVMVTSLDEAKARLAALQEFVQSCMREGLEHDFAQLPGTNRKTLLKPGAEKLCEIYGLVPRYETERTEDWERMFFLYHVTCRLFRGDRCVGEASASANSRESKYAGRWVGAHEVPEHLDKSTLRCKKGARWVFASELRDRGISQEGLPTQERTSRKGGGKYLVYRLDESTWFVPNTEIADQVNTLERMAAKRALVGAVISVTRSADIFAPDMEDVVANATAAGTKPEAPDADYWDDDPSPSPPEPATAAEWAKLFDAAKTPNELKALGKRANGKDVDDREKMEASYKANVERLKGAK
jgi:hypothetical protein